MSAKSSPMLRPAFPPTPQARLPRLNRINYKDPVNLRAAVLVACGYSDKFIREQTGLSPGQINYRAKQVHVSRREYRDGTSPFAKLMVQKMYHTFEGRVRQLIPMTKPQVKISHKEGDAPIPARGN